MVKIIHQKQMNHITHSKLKSGMGLGPYRISEPRRVAPETQTGLLSLSSTASNFINFYDKFNIDLYEFLNRLDTYTDERKIDFSYDLLSDAREYFVFDETENTYKIRDQNLLNEITDYEARVNLYNMFARRNRRRLVRLPIINIPQFILNLNNLREMNLQFRNPNNESKEAPENDV